jgi:nitronate monooxygenase
MFWPDTISKKLGVKYPVVQAPMFGMSTPEMVAAAGKAGCLGSLALADLSADQSVELIRETRNLQISLLPSIFLPIAFLR